MKFFSLFYQGDVHLGKERKVLSAKEYSTLVDADEVLGKAREDADKYQKQVEKECEELKEKAKQEGFQEGLGLFNQHIIHFDTQLKEMRQQLMHKVLPLALKAAKKIVSAEIEMHPERIVDIVLQALAPATQSQKVTIYVHRGDKDILEKSKQRLKEIFERIDLLSIQERDDVPPGGCMIETETGIINASMEGQWRALEAAFEKYNK